MNTFGAEGLSGSLEPRRTRAIHPEDAGFHQVYTGRLHLFDEPEMAGELIHTFSTRKP